MERDVLEAAIAAEVERFAIPGCAVTVVQNGELILARGFGKRNVEDDLPVTEQTLFPIGSSTKAFTASVIATLVDDGHFEWDTPVVELLPGFKMYDPVATRELTPRDMLCHRSGLPRHDLLWYNNTELTRAEVVQRLRYLQPNKGFRETWQYNNLLYLTAGHLTEHVLGCTWEQAVRDRLLEPLGMTNSNFSVTESAKSDDHALPYIDKDGVNTVVPLRGLDLAGPAGSINSCIADMKQWALLNAGDGEVGGKRVLSTAAMKQLHAPTMVLQGNELSSISDLYHETYLTSYALGWVRESYRGHPIVHHGGNIDGFSSMVSLLPSENLGIVVLTNLHGTASRGVIPYVIYDLVLGLDPIPWGERLRPLELAARAGGKAAHAHADAKRKKAPPSHPLDDYAGTYEHPGYGCFVISVRDDELQPHYNNLVEFELSHRHYDVWDLKLEVFESVMPLSFGIDAAGDVDSLSVPLEGLVDPIVFTRVPDPALSDPARLQSLTGTYAMGPLQLRVELDPAGNLIGSLMGQTLRLRPHRGYVFKIAGEQTTVEFDDGKAILEGSGVFERESDAGN